MNNTQNKKRLLLIGKLGHGKSSLGNTLLGDKFFTIGNQTGGVTIEIKTAESEEYTITDCPGFGDLYSKHLFFDKIKQYKTEMLNNTPYDGIILVVKFDIHNTIDNLDSSAFNGAIDDFYEAFGEDGLKSLMVLCIQNGVEHNKDDFKVKFESTEGYIKLQNKNKGKIIPYVLWDNNKPNKRQLELFRECLGEIQPFTEISMNFSFQLIERFIRDHPRPDPIPLPQPNVSYFNKYFGRIFFWKK